MLLQSHRGEIDLLPALPLAWPTGSVKGMRARGGFEIVGLAWSNGRLTGVAIRSTLGGSCRVRYGAATAVRSMAPGEVIALNANLR
jgi:alpha-L-fucosidase 2